MSQRNAWEARAARLKEASEANNRAADRRRRGQDGKWDTSHPTYAAWEATVEAFWAAARATYPPGFWNAYEDLKAGGQSGVETAIEFLEADPICFRSGYLKSDILKFLGRLSLTPRQCERLRCVVLAVTARRYDREFRRYCRMAGKLDGPEFRQSLQALVASDDPDVRRRAGWVLEAIEQHRRMMGQGSLSFPADPEQTSSRGVAPSCLD
jgi:hypothetical protein